MDIKEVEKIRNAMKNKSTEELLCIWEKNDRESWRNETFIAIQETLTLRGIALPAQTDYAKSQIKDNSLSKFEKKEIMIGWACVILGGLLAIYSALFSSLIILPTGLIFAGIVTLTKYGILDK